MSWVVHIRRSTLHQWDGTGIIHIDFQYEGKLETDSHKWTECKRLSAVCHLVKPWKEPLTAKPAISVSFPLLSTPLAMDTKKYSCFTNMKVKLSLCHVALRAMRYFSYTTHVYIRQTPLPFPLNINLRFCPSVTHSTVIILVFS